MRDSFKETTAPNSPQSITVFRSGVLLLSFLSGYLFYSRSIGVNILLFTLCSIGVYYVLYIKSKILTWYEVRLRLTSLLLTATMLCIVPQELTYWLWLLSYILFWGFSVQIQFSLFMVLHSLVSIKKSLLRPLQSFRSIPNDTSSQEVSTVFTKQNALMFLVITAIVSLFVLLYAQSNPVIARGLEAIFSFRDFSYFDGLFFLFVVVVYLFLWGIVYVIYKSSRWLMLDKSTPLYVQSDTCVPISKSFYDIARFSLLAVSVVLILVNLIDIFVLVSSKLPQGVSYAEFVHQGFNTLLFSIVLAIALVGYFYKGGLHFVQENKSLVRLATFWIVQNAILLCTTGYKNILYVTQYGLTYKRIFVFVVLLILTGALYILRKKITYTYTNFNYFNKVLVWVYLSLLGVSLVPIDIVITHYNLKYAQSKDSEYVGNLSHPDILLFDKKYKANGYYYNTSYTLIEQNIKDAKSYSWQSMSYYHYLLLPLDY